MEPLTVAMVHRRLPPYPVEAIQAKLQDVKA